MKWKFFVESKPWSGVENLRIARRHINGTDVVQPFTLKSYGPNEFIGDDNVALEGNEFIGEGGVRDFLQAAMDAAWELGLRPAGAADQTNEIKAVRDHLADMRTLALK